MIRTLLVLFLFTRTAYAQEPSYTRVLLPIGATDINGAFGTRWSVSLNVFNGSADELTLLPEEAPCPVLCPIGPIPAGGTEGYALWGADYYGGPRGLLLHVPHSQARDVAFTLAVAGGACSGFTEIPVVREADFFSGPLALPNLVNTKAHAEVPYRAALRIYALPDEAEARVGVRILTREGAVVHEQILALQMPPPNERRAYFPAELTWVGFEDALPRDVRASTVTVQVVPLTARLRIWAFATLTDNETQRVSTVTAQ